MATNEAPADGPPSSTNAPRSVEPDPAYYTWSTWFSILTGSASQEATQKYWLTRDVANEERDCKRCDEWKETFFKRSPVIRFMREEINKFGHDVNTDNVRCRRCTTRQGGGFDRNYGILLCANHLMDKSHAEDTLAHEMVHAYDHLRFDVKDNDLRHQACTEIRASTLSGECRFAQEFFSRGQMKFGQQLQECVRRRATLSLKSRPNCKDDVQAARIVNEVWDHCFTDTRPFDEIYR